MYIYYKIQTILPVAAIKAAFRRIIFALTI